MATQISYSLKRILLAWMGVMGSSDSKRLKIRGALMVVKQYFYARIHQRASNLKPCASTRHPTQLSQQ
jgi:hypothetical protein